MTATRPNILWIVTTQWRAQACGYAGDPNAATPHLDAFAREARNYAQAVTPHPFGPFARAALLTGMPSPQNGVREYHDPLPLAARTVAHGMAERGYVTAYFGKWHLAPRDPEAPLVGEAHARTVVPRERWGGFAFWEGFEGGFLLNDPWLHGTRRQEPVQVRGYQSDVLCARVAAWLAPERPWFCVLSLEAPHPPYAAPSAGVLPRPPSEIVLPANVPRGGDVEAQARRELAGYYAHIAATDRALGRLLMAVPPETIMVFTSVHGDMHGAHGLFRKGWPHEESLGVPLLVRGPGIAAGRDDALVTLLDLPHWALAWADGRPTPPTARDLQAISMPSVVALPHQCDRVWRGGRTRARKLVLNALGTPWLYFDLERDPEEEVNHVADGARQAEIAALRRRILSLDA